MDKPGPPEEPVEPLSARSGRFLIVGVVIYVVGFVVLAHNQPDLAPFLIVGGILSMMWAFLN